MALRNPVCHGMSELPNAGAERERLNALICEGAIEDIELSSEAKHISKGLALTIGSALGQFPPSADQCLSAFQATNKVGLTAGARAWSKHAHRSAFEETQSFENNPSKVDSIGWWGSPRGSVSIINDKALSLFWKVTNATTWRNLHWLPHDVLVYEVRVVEGYGMRWSKQCAPRDSDGDVYKQREDAGRDSPWTFRGFVEPMMENGHELGWRHSIVKHDEE